MKINTFSYVTEHGRNPRGRGSWAFQPGDGAGNIYHDVEPVWSPSMTYTEARKWIHKQWSAYPDIYVLP